jgi:hypothetical protein
VRKETGYMVREVNNYKKVKWSKDMKSKSRFMDEVFGRCKCRHARGGEGERVRARARAVPGFAATLCSGLRGVYESLIYRQAAVTVLCMPLMYDIGYKLYFTLHWNDSNDPSPPSAAAEGSICLA